MKNNPLVSLVITTRNEEKNISNCLESIFGQEECDFAKEIIVVDNHSEDRTLDLARSFGDVKIFTIGPERNLQRNFGLLEIAQGKYSMWIDADMILHPSLLRNSVDMLERNQDIVGLYIPEIILGNSIYARSRRFERRFYDGTVVDGTRFIRSDALKKIGGFSTDWLHGPDDWDLDLRLASVGKLDMLKIHKPALIAPFNKMMMNKFKIEIGQYPISIYHNESNLKLIRHLKKKAHYSTDTAAYINRWGKKHPVVMKQLGLRYRYCTVFFEDGKWRMVLSNPFLFLTTIYFKVLVGIVYLFNVRKPS